MANTKLYDAARKHVTVGVEKMFKAGASLAEIEYAVATGLENAGMISAAININVKER